MIERHRRKTRIFAGTLTRDGWRKVFVDTYRKTPCKRLVSAFVITILIHIVVYVSAPKTIEVFAELSPVVSVNISELENVELPNELLPEEFRKKNEPEFIPVNPNAPSAIPDETNMHAATNQRAAQEKPDSATLSRVPENDGELKDSRGIAQNLVPRELLPAELRSAQTLQHSKKSNEARGMSIEEKKETGIEDKKNEDGNVSAGNLEDFTSQESDGVPEPQERPTVISPAGLNTITMKSNTATNEIGAVSLDAKYSEFGNYTQRMLEAIQAAWYVRIETGSIANRSGVVHVQFTLCSDGTVKDVKVLYSSAPEAATYACVDAIESRAPFEIWKDEMLELLGSEQTSTLSFYYR